MADKKIEGLTAITVQSGTDLYEVSLNGAGSRKETRDQQVAYLLNLFAPQFTAANTVYVDPNGNNLDPGTQSEPYADPFAASAAITGTVANPKLIVINSGDYNTTSFTLKPNQTFSGFGYTTKVDVTNPITLDASWSSADIGSFVIINNLFWENNFDLDFSTYGLIKGALFNGSILGNVTITGASDNVPQVQFENCDIGDTLVESANADFYGCQWSGSDEDITIQSSGAGGNTSFDISNCLMGVGTDVLISGASGSTTSGRIFSSPIRGTLTVDTTFVTLTIDAASIPAAGITYTNGATDAQVTKVGNAPGKSFNNTFTAQNGIAPVAITSTSNSIAWNLNDAPNAIHILTEDTTLDEPTNPIDGFTYELLVVQHASSAKTLAFNSKFKFSGNVTPVISSVLSSRTRLTAKYYAALDIYDTSYSLDYRA